MSEIVNQSDKILNETVQAVEKLTLPWWNNPVIVAGGALLFAILVLVVFLFIMARE